MGESHFKRLAPTRSRVFFADCFSPCARTETLLLGGKDLPELSKEAAVKLTTSTMGSTTNAAAASQAARKQMVSFVG